MSRVAIGQSNYFPWKGYFDLIHDVDVFIFFDDVQYTKNDWRNRNRVKSPRGPQWLTVPVGAHIHREIREVAIPDARWQSQHWKTLGQLYAKAAFFDTYRGFLEEVYLKRQWANLSELNRFLIERVARDFLGIRTTFRCSTEFAVTGRKQDRVLSLLSRVGATAYVSGPSAQAYMEPERFAEAGVALTWKDYAGYPEYPQFHPPFEHRVSILDLLFHVGPAAPDYLWGWRTAAGGRG
jgi:hypothetical protein